MPPAPRDRIPSPIPTRPQEFDEPPRRRRGLGLIIAAVCLFVSAAVGAGLGWFSKGGAIRQMASALTSSESPATQGKDIKAAKAMWEAWKEENNDED